MSAYISVQELTGKMCDFLACVQDGKSKVESTDVVVGCWVVSEEEAKESNTPAGSIVLQIVSKGNLSNIKNCMIPTKCTYVTLQPDQLSRFPS